LQLVTFGEDRVVIEAASKFRADEVAKRFGHDLAALAGRHVEIIARRAA
jgi:hypothetical protein